jgi:hypothetical protein
MSPTSDISTSDISTSDLLEGISFFPIALVISATIAPGLTLCIPGLIFVTVLLLIPIVALALVAGLVAAIVMAPFALVRGVRWLHGAMARAPEPVMTRELSA